LFGATAHKKSRPRAALFALCSAGLFSSSFSVSSSVNSSVSGSSSSVNGSFNNRVYSSFVGGRFFGAIASNQSYQSESAHEEGNFFHFCFVFLGELSSKSGSKVGIFNTSTRVLKKNLQLF
jgi:hypothetical protein